MLNLNQNPGDRFNFEEYFFVIDSDNFENVKSDIYGFAVQSDGIYNRDNFDKLDPKALEGCGTYVHIEKTPEETVIRQDGCGNFGLYLFQEEGYYAISNSFFLLVEHIKNDHKITVNEDFVNHFMATWITSLSYSQTALNEVTYLPSNAVVKLIDSKTIKVEYTNSEKYNSLSVDSKEGVEQIDRWYTKWLNIIRGAVKNTDQLCVDLSGGMDSRLVFTFFLNSGLDLSKNYIRSLNDGKHTHVEDFEIANEMAAKYGFEINKKNNVCFDTIPYSESDIDNMTYLCKMMCQKELTFPAHKYAKRRIWFGGFGGELIRPYWGMRPSELMTERLHCAVGYPKDTADKIRSSTKRIMEDTFASIRDRYGINDKESPMISFNAFRDCYSRNHFGKIATEALMCNAYKMSPSMDPLIQGVSLDAPGCKDGNLLAAFIFTRYRKDILDIRFDGKRSFDKKTLEFAEKINEKYPLPEGFFDAEDVSFQLIEPEKGDESLVSKEEIKRDDTEKKFLNYYQNKRADTEKKYLDYYHTYAFKKYFSEHYDKAFYDVADEFSKVKPYFPLRHIYSNIAVLELTRAVNKDESLNIRTEYKVMNPKVSVVIPCYNVEQYLRECIESALNQTLPDIEIICVNDGSTDGTLGIIKEYMAADDRVKLVDKANSGYGNTMNRGMDAATGEYIAILESDDYIKPNMYETLYGLAKKHDLDFIKSDYEIFVGEGQDRTFTYMDTCRKRSRCYKVINPSENIDVLNERMNTWTGIYKKAFLNEYNIRHNETPGASYQDNGFWFQTFLWAKRIMFADMAFYQLRRDNPNSSVHNKGKVFCIFEEYAFIESIVRSNPEKEKTFIKIFQKKKFDNCSYHYRRVGDEFKMDFLERMSEEFKKAREAGELDSGLFFGNGWNDLCTIMDKPEAYYAQTVNKVSDNLSIEKKYQIAQKELENIKKSKSYKIGRLITFIPRKTVGGVRCLKENGMRYTVRRCFEKLKGK